MLFGSTGMDDLFHESLLTVIGLERKVNQNFFFFFVSSLVVLFLGKSRALIMPTKKRNFPYPSVHFACRVLFLRLLGIFFSFFLFVYVALLPCRRDRNASFSFCPSPLTFSSSSRRLCLLLHFLRRELREAKEKEGEEGRRRRRKNPSVLPIFPSVSLSAPGDVEPCKKSVRRNERRKHGQHLERKPGQQAGQTNVPQRGRERSPG